MFEKIIKLPVEYKTPMTDEKVPVKSVLLGADKADLEATIVIGWTKEGDFYFASSDADGGDILWLLESAKKRLMEVDLETDLLQPTPPKG